MYINLAIDDMTDCVKRGYDRVCVQTKPEAMFLNKVACKIMNGKILEIGRKMGGSLIVLCLSSPDSRVYSMDISTAHIKRVKQNLKYYGVRASQYKLITADSTGLHTNFKKKVLRKAKEKVGAKFVYLDKLDMLFVDGDHRREFVIQDLIRWTPRVIPGGSILLHDYYSDKYKLEGVDVEANSKFKQYKLQYADRCGRSCLFTKVKH